MAQTEPGFPRLDKQTRPWVCKYDNETCLYKKPCPRCLGARNKRKGQKKQRAAAKTIEKLSGVSVGRYSSQTGNEENWRSSARYEAKAGQQVQGFTTTFLKAEAQSDAAHAHGDARPFIFLAIPDGWPEGECLMTVRSRDVRAFVDAFTIGAA